MNAFASCRVLIIDDNRDIANCVAALLRTVGHIVLPAYDGLTALALVAEFKPNVAILDLNMPGMDGFEIAKRLRAIAELSPLKIIALTGRDEPESIRATADAGFDAHLIKPTNGEDLLNAVVL